MSSFLSMFSSLSAEAEQGGGRGGESVDAARLIKTPDLNL